MLRTMLAALLLIGSAAMAEVPRVIGWDDLLPPEEPLENPFDDLAADVRDDLLFVERIKTDMQWGFVSEGDEDHGRMLEAEQSLRDRGIDLEALQKAAEILDAEIERRNALTVSALDGQVVRIPGYALPLEMTDEGVREFLLVPYVGACIHVPPPPPNQMVFVELDEDYMVRDLYEPVWITGQIRIEAASRLLSFVDGEDNVATGYALRGVTIEPYE